MPNIKKLKQNGEEFYPVTHEDAIVDATGTPISLKYINAIDTEEGTDIIIDETNNPLIEDINSSMGDLNSLATNNKDSLVNAINELFQSANNGKQLIADAIGSPLSPNDTFSAMSSNIDSLLNTFKIYMLSKGSSISSGDKFKDLILKIPSLQEGSGSTTIISPFPKWHSGSDIWIENHDMTTNVSITGLAHHCSIVYEGKIYYFGGRTSGSSKANSTVYVYDPEANTLSAFGDAMPTPVYDFTANEYNGKVYCLGGRTEDSTPKAPVQIFDLQTGVWTSGESCSVSKHRHLSCLKDGVIYVTSGVSVSTLINTTYSYDIASNSWTTTGYGNSLSVYDEGVSFLHNDYWYVLYGTIIKRFDFSEKIWSSVTSTFPTELSVADSSCVISGNKAYILYGLVSSTKENNGCYSLDLDNFTWTELDFSPNSRASAEVNLIDGIVYCFGGADSENVYTNTMDCYILESKLESASKSGGLDIISATELPAEGEENQICVITQNPTENFIFSPLPSDLTTVDDTIGGELSYSPVSSSVLISQGNQSYRYNILKFLQNSTILPSYIYQNDMWNNFTYEHLYAVKDKMDCPNTLLGGMHQDASFYTNDGLVLAASSSYTYYLITVKNPIDFTLYNKVYIRFRQSKASSGGDSLYVASSTAYRHQQPASFSFDYYAYEYTKVVTYKNTDPYSTTQEYIVDITNWTSTGYFGLFWLTYATDYMYAYVEEVYLY